MGKTKGKSGGTQATDNNGASSALGSCSQVKVRHILCEKHSKISEALAKIQAGEKFDASCSHWDAGGTKVGREDDIEEGDRALKMYSASAVATSYSEDAARKGGDLGWKRRNELVGPFAEAAFKLQVGQMSDIIKTQFGYHVILCEGRKA